MEDHPQCALCVHDTMRISENGDPLGILFNGNQEERDYSVEDVIIAKGGGLFHTSSFFYRVKDVLKMPSYYLVKGLGDYTTAIYLSMRGYVHYFPQVMSAYRVGAQTSWVRKMTAQPNRMSDVNENLIKTLEMIDTETQRTYTAAFTRVIQMYRFDNCVLANDGIEILLNKEMRTVLKQRPQMQQLKLIGKMCRNKLYGCLKRKK